MASAAGSLTLKGFNINGIIANEGRKVKLDESENDGSVKRFVIAD
jgi:hypothetical protein